MEEFKKPVPNKPLTSLAERLTRSDSTLGNVGSYGPQNPEPMGLK